MNTKVQITDNALLDLIIGICDTLGYNVDVRHNEWEVWVFDETHPFPYVTFYYDPYCTDEENIRNILQVCEADFTWSKREFYDDNKERCEEINISIDEYWEEYKQYIKRLKKFYDKFRHQVEDSLF